MKKKGYQGGDQNSQLEFSRQNELDVEFAMAKYRYVKGTQSNLSRFKDMMKSQKSMNKSNKSRVILKTEESQLSDNEQETRQDKPFDFKLKLNESKQKLKVIKKLNQVMTARVTSNDDSSVLPK